MELCVTTIDTFVINKNTSHILHGSIISCLVKINLLKHPIKMYQKRSFTQWVIKNL